MVIEGFSGGACALPDHLKDRLHDDWIWPLNKLPRAVNAYGPRCSASSESYRAWPPRLVAGYGVSRWESNHAFSILEIPDLSWRAVHADDVYGKMWSAIERNPGNPNFGQEGTVILSWYEMTWSGIQSNAITVYSPSAIQEFSQEGWMELSPAYKTSWFRLFGKTPNYGRGYRPDHVDIYYNYRQFYGGLSFE